VGNSPSDGQAAYCAAAAVDVQPVGHEAVLSVEASRSHVGVCAVTDVQPAGQSAEPSVAASRSHVLEVSVVFQSWYIYFLEFAIHH